MPEPTEPANDTRRRAQKPVAKKRRYAAELADLQRQVERAKRFIRKAAESASGEPKTFLTVALEMLEGE